MSESVHKTDSAAQTSPRRIYDPVEAIASLTDVENTTSEVWRVAEPTLTQVCRAIHTFERSVVPPPARSTDTPTVKRHRAAYERRRKMLRMRLALLCVQCCRGADSDATLKFYADAGKWITQQNSKCGCSVDDPELVDDEAATQLVLRGVTEKEYRVIRKLPIICEYIAAASRRRICREKKRAYALKKEEEAAEIERARAALDALKKRRQRRERTTGPTTKPPRATTDDKAEPPAKRAALGVAPIVGCKLRSVWRRADGQSVIQFEFGAPLGVAGAGDDDDDVPAVTATTGGTVAIGRDPEGSNMSGPLDIEPEKPRVCTEDADTEGADVDARGGSPIYTTALTPPALAGDRKQKWSPRHCLPADLDLPVDTDAFLSFMD